MLYERIEVYCCISGCERTVLNPRYCCCKTHFKEYKHILMDKAALASPEYAWLKYLIKEWGRQKYANIRDAQRLIPYDWVFGEGDAEDEWN